VAAWQERAYGELAEASGMGWDPKAAFAALHVAPPKDASKATSIVKDLVGPAGSTIDWKTMQLETEKKTANYFQESDSFFEDPTFIVPARQYLDQILQIPTWRDDYTLKLEPFVASMPSLGFTSLTRAFPNEKQAVILVQHGVFMFLYQIASSVAAAIPWDWFPRKKGWRSQFGTSMVMSGSALNVLRAREHLQSTLYAYVTTGTSRPIEALRLSGFAQQWQVELFVSAAMFILAHEISHIALGHLTAKGGGSQRNAWNPETEVDLLLGGSQNDAWERETEADILGTYATLTAGLRSSVHPQVATLGCALAALAWQAVDVGVNYLEAGKLEMSLRPSHPPGLRRANVIVNAISAGESISSGTDAGEDLHRKLRQAIQLIQDLVTECVTGFDAARQSGARPSPVWRLDPPVIVTKEGR
jgi:hypothetical protein